MASFPFTHREALRDLPRKSWTWEEPPSGLPRDLWPSFVSLCCSKASKCQAVYFNCPKSKLLRFPHPAAALLLFFVGKETWEGMRWAVSNNKYKRNVRFK